MSNKSQKQTNLSKKLSSLMQPKPTLIESDDEDLITADKIDSPEGDSITELGESKLARISGHEFLDENDEKYSGKGISRRDLLEFADSDFSEDCGSVNNSDTSTSSEYEGSEICSESENEECATSNAVSDRLESKNFSNNLKNNWEEHDPHEKIFSKAVSDIEKGTGVKNQLHIWDFLLDCRMKFQEGLIASNQFPDFTNFLKFKNVGDPEFQESVNQTKKSLKNLLKSLLQLQEVLLQTNSEFLHTRNDLKITESNSNKYHDKECDRFNEIEEATETDSALKLKTLGDFSSEINKRHKNFEVYRNNTIQKWNDKTKIGYTNNKNFSAFEQSTLKQIEHVLLDKQRLIKRTQTKRSNYHILGEKDEPQIKKSGNVQNENLLSDVSDIKNKSVIKKEIFDDDDFYHQLLSELVKRKVNDITDPVQLGRQWMQLQKIRSKMKKTVDVKASKGRKVRFVVHPKLVNFMMPFNNSYYGEDSRTEFLNSLFGNNKK